MTVGTRPDKSGCSSGLSHLIIWSRALGIPPIRENPGTQDQGTVLIGLPIAVLVEPVAHIGLRFHVAPHTHSPGAGIPTGTRIAIIASIGIGNRLAQAVCGIAGIIGTQIAVVAVFCRTRCTDSRQTGVLFGAQIPVLARVARGGSARAAGRGFAPIAGARVSIVAGHRDRAGAHTVGAGIHFRTGIPVTAWTRIVAKNAISRAEIAILVCAGVGIVAVFWGTILALAPLAHITEGTKVSVLTGSVHILVRAPTRWGASVVGTGVVVIAR